MIVLSKTETLYRSHTFIYIFCFSTLKITFLLLVQKRKNIFLFPKFVRISKVFGHVNYDAIMWPGAQLVQFPGKCDR